MENKEDPSSYRSFYYDVYSIEQPDDKGDDLSAYSEDSYEAEVKEVPLPRVMRSIEPNQPQVPIMKGQYEIANGICSWIGIWGMGIDDTILGLTSEFRYTFKGSIESDASPPLSGAYTGYFFYKTNVPRRVYEKDLTLEFTPLEGRFQMFGKGQNEFGYYILNGIFDPGTKDLTCTKEYQPVPQNKKKVKKTAKPSKPKPKQVTVKEEKSTDEMTSCLAILQHLIDHESSGPFLAPVDPVKLNIPDYLEIIKHPMDLGTIKKQLKNNEIKTKEEFVEKVRLVFDNAVLYNKPYDEVSVMANTLSEFFEKELAGNQTVFGTPSKSKASSSLSNQNGIQFRKKKRFADNILETYRRITTLGRSESCDLVCQNETVNLFIKECQVQRKRERERMQQKEVESCGIVIKPDSTIPIQYEELISLKNELQQLPQEKCEELFKYVFPSLNLEKEFSINLNEVSVSDLRRIMICLQKNKEEAFIDYLQKEEVKRRKQVTEKLMQSGKKSLAELLSD